ncbi:MAG TPA: hypothetical protein ENF54_03610 [Desulfobacteraceae bacterium]|nr:hypothetical protein [Desulfobacteraceae bacterium]
MEGLYPPHFFMDVREEIKREIERGNIIRAAFLSLSLGDISEDIKKEALWQASSIYRNPYTTKALSNELGMQRDEVVDLLRQISEEKERQGKEKELSSCYDLYKMRYLSFHEWLEDLKRDWDKF